MKTIALTFSSDTIIRRFSIACFVMAILLVTAYVYFVNATIMRIVTWQKTEKTITDLRPELGTLEASYLSLERTITMAKAVDLQFESAVAPEFISRKSLGKGISLRNDL